VNALAESVGERAACALLGSPRATLQRHRKPQCDVAPSAASCHKARQTPRRLSDSERRAILDHAHSERFCDRSVRQIYATLLDEGTYVASISTWYRVLRAAGETRERRRQATHPATIKPELVATQPGDVWTWDITKLLGPTKWTYYYLYVVLDIFSRYVVAWRLEYRESATLAREMIEEAIMREGIDPTRLTIHADRGTSMTSKTVAQLYSDLGVTKSFSRPHVSDDNPFSEAQFKTLKYVPHFPPHFANIEHGRDYCRRFFPWYNDEHRHSGIALLTPADVHFGRAQIRTDARREVLRAAWEAHPERFVRGLPQPPAIAPAIFINPPEAA
jgi:putative transposase